MAKILPKVDPSQLEHPSEAPVYTALRDQLSDDYTVLHSYPWLRRWRGEALVEGEADFVILHPARGMLVLEVKGGDTIRHDGSRWFRDTERGPREFKDPFRQAARNMHALLNIAEQRSGGKIRRSDFVHGYAAVFPHMNYEGEPPPHADRAIVISMRELPRMAEAVEAALAAWTESPRGLGADRFRLLLRECVMPSFRLFRPVGPDLARASEQLLRLTENQAAVFRGLYEQDRVLVKGVAGSGKTFLALHRALAFAREGKRTLLLCFNRDLAAWLRAQVEADPQAEELEGELVIDNFHHLAKELADRAKLDFWPADGRKPDQRFWDEEAADIVDQAAMELPEDDRFDAVVVDEAQDFLQLWWFTITQSLLKDPDGPLYAFMDPNQSLRGEVEKPDFSFEASFQLNINCRNTRRISAASASLLSLNSETHGGAPLGAALRIHRAPKAQQKNAVLQELRALLGREDLKPAQIALIGPASKKKGSLAGLNEIDGVPVVTSAQEWRDGGGVLITTSRSFKGLEADVVILYDLEGFGKLFRLEDLYVACTRAKLLLIAFAQEGAAQDALLTAQGAAERERG